MSFPNYVKKYDVGTVRLDAPYAEFIHELPLLSFSDVLHTVNLSLVYHSNRGNAFNITYGFKLSLQKSLIMSNGVPQSYEDGYGIRTSLIRFGDKYAFDDDSQRFLRKIDNAFVLENADYSKETFDSAGKILSVTDKYGEEIFTYDYESGLLTTIAYRNEVYKGGKAINLSYLNSRLSEISFNSNGSSFKSYVSYSVNQVVVNHYSDVDYHVGLSNDGSYFEAYSSNSNSDYSDDFSQRITCVAETNSLTVKKEVGSKTVDQATYDFLSYNTDDPFKLVNITDFYGIKRRIQYEDRKPLYSYEIPDSSFTTGKIYTGTVSFHNNDEVVGSQTFTSGMRMTYNDNLNNWFYDVPDETESLNDYLVISGWVKKIKDSTISGTTPSLTVTVIDNMLSSGITIPIGNLTLNEWTYFSVRINASGLVCPTAYTNLNTNQAITADFRITPQHESELAGGACCHMSNIEDLLTGDNSPTFNLSKIKYSFYNGSALINEEITANDILRYKLNKAYGSNSGEIYYNNCRGVISTSDNLYIGYTSSGSSSVTKIDVASLSVEKLYYVGDNTYTVRTDVTSESTQSQLQIRSYKNNEMYENVIYDKNLDVLYSQDEKQSITFYHRNEKGLIDQIDYPLSITRRATYDTDFTKLLSTTNEFGKTTTYTTDYTWGTVTKTTLSDRTSVTDAFDDDLDTPILRTFEKDSEKKEREFKYTNGNLWRIADDSIYYNFSYSGGNLTGVSKSGEQIEEHVLSDNDKTLTSYYPSASNTIYSTKQTVDNYGRTTEISNLIKNTYDVDPTYSSGNYSTLGVDNGSGKLAQSTDLTNGNVTKFGYEKDRISNIGVFNSSGTNISSESISYDEIGRVTSNEHSLTTSSSEKITIKETRKYATEVTNKKTDNRVGEYSYALNGDIKTSSTNTYDDAFNRLTDKVISIGGLKITKDYNYDSARLSNINHSISSASSSSILSNHVYIWDCDDQLRTTIEHDYISGGYTNTYEYDSFGRLARENNQVLDKTYVYDYNEGGNITSAKAYDYTTGEVSGTPVTTSYVYDSVQPDRLTAFDGNAITYDNNGCVKSYDGWTFTWTRGRLTKCVRGTKLSGIDTYTYAYDAYGRRISKKYTFTKGTQSLAVYISSSSTLYTYDSSGRLIREKYEEIYNDLSSNSRDILYLYDESDIIGVVHTYNSTTETYYFDRNVSGDVVNIYNASGARVAKYSYDAWGNSKLLTPPTDIFSVYNPIRYRGYYYDSETGFYFLNSRYYNPQWRRFISPDDTAYLDPETPNGLNLYAYCGNDPVNYKQMPVSLEGSFTDSVLSGTIGGGLVPVISFTGGSSEIFNQTLKGSFRNGLLFGSESITGLYADWNARAQISLRKGTVKVGIAGKFSALNVSGQIGFGTDDLNLSLKAVGDTLTVSGMAGIFIVPQQNTYFIGVEAKAVALSGRVGGQLDTFGLQLEVGLSGELGSIGGRLGIGLRPTNDGKMEFYYGSGFALGVGWDFYIRIRFDELF